MIEEMIIALKNLMDRKLRTFLSTLSILIGITSIFALVSFGIGLQNYMNTVAAEAGVDKLYVYGKGVGAPGTDENFFISRDEAKFIEKIKGVAEIAPMYAKAGQIAFKDEKRYGFVIGFSAENQQFVDEAFTVTVEKGRNLKKGELDKVGLGYNYQLDKKIFTRGLKLGDKLNINGKPFEVVSFYEEVGNPSDDSNIYLEEAAFESLFPETEGRYGFVILGAEDGQDVNLLADKIQEKLRKYKGQEKGKEDFFVQTFEDAIAIFANIMTVISAILVLIALISVLVATVNIMNTMYTTVLERTNEIGVMKAIGARNSDIMIMFLLESGFMGFIGGALGILVGYLIAKLGGQIAAKAGYSFLQPSFPLWLTIGCLLFSFLVGSFAGAFPARQASKLKPVDALRYE